MRQLAGKFDKNSLQIKLDGKRFTPPADFNRLKKKVWLSLKNRLENREGRPWNGKVYRLSEVSRLGKKMVLHLSIIDFATHYTAAFSQKILKGKNFSRFPNGMYIGSYIKTADNKLIFGINSQKGITKNEINFIGGVLNKDEMIINNTGDLFKFFEKEFEEETGLKGSLIKNLSGLGVFQFNNYRVGVILTCLLGISSEKVAQLSSLNFEHKGLLFVNPHDFKKTLKKYQVNPNISDSYSIFLKGI